MKKIVSSLLFIVFSFSILLAQAPKKLTSGEIFEAIQKLNFFGTVLYVAAHPDDENTRLISYFSNDIKARTAYLSITRGDGGQNLIGSEIRELLGVIRTQELLAARRIDGGEQFFTRANDFGYSKHPNETLAIWNKKEVLNDVVGVIRKFKPDVIVNRFNHKTPGSTHGHHTSSAMLSVEAFDLAADRSYKTHIKNDDIWTPKRMFFNTSWWFYGSRENFAKADKTNLISVDVGTYYPQKGLSNNEIASLSRSQHQSQGFGSVGIRGGQLEYLELIQGDFPKNNKIFEGIDTSWNRLKGGSEIGEILTKVENDFDFKNPSNSISELVKAYQLIQNLEDEHWRQIKIKEIKQIITACAGLYLEAIAHESSATSNNKINISIEMINRSMVEIDLKSAVISSEEKIIVEGVRLKNNKKFTNKSSIYITKNMSYTSPYWLRKKGSLGMYNLVNEEFVGLPETPRSINIRFDIKINNTVIPFYRDVVFKYNNPVKGEVYKPFEILPEVSASFNEKIYVFSNGATKKISVKISSVKDSLIGKLSLTSLKSWQIEPKNYEFKIAQKGEEQTFEFNVTPPINQSEGYISPIIEIEDKIYSDELVEIEYNHIPFQSVIIPSEAKVVRLDIQKKGQLIGYIQGAGDVIPTSLRQMGYTVVELKDEEIKPEKLKNFDAIILGIRAYNTNERSKFYQKHLHDYVKMGGTLIAQYNTSHRLKVKEVGPYTLKLSRDRVTEENSEVKILNPNHELLNYPNKIKQEDFNGWVQERGLYFPNEWSEEFVPVISMNDKNESPKKGSLLIADYGKGKFIYTGLSFFRELPAGVPGAYKLFANMLSVGKNNMNSTLKN